MKNNRVAMKDILVELEQNGSMKKLIDGGFVSTKMSLYYEVFLEYDKAMKTRKESGKMQIISDVASTFRISEITVRRIIKIMCDENRCSDSDARR